MISIDWLQAFCIGSLIDDGDYPYNDGFLRVERQDGGTANFVRRLLVFHKGVEIATILQQPKYAIFDKKMTEVKLHNRVLYTAVPCKVLVCILKSLGLTYRGISRIDLACDCNTLAGGRSVEELISSFVHLGNGVRGHVVRKGSAKYILHGNNHRKAHIRHESIKFGSPQSACVPYIYNKSLELISEKDKPWIREAWREAGLVHLIDREGLQCMTNKELAARLDDAGVSEFIRSGVWRFEISIKAKGKDLLNLSDGELFKLDLEQISTAEKVESLFVAYASKYFCFRECTRDGQRIRDYRDIMLFDYSNKVDYKPYSIPVTGETGKFDQAVVNYLNKTLRTYSDLASPVVAGISETKDMISMIAGAKAYKLKKKRYDDYLASLMCTQFYESLERDVMNECSSLEESRDVFREYLAWFHSEQSI